MSLDAETAVARTRLAPRLPHGSVVIGRTGPGAVTFADVSVAPVS